RLAAARGRRRRPRRRLARAGAGATHRAELENPRAERTRNQLDGELCGLVLAVQDRIHLHDLERAGETGLRDQLHSQMRLAVREAAADRRTDARSDVRHERLQTLLDRARDELRHPLARLLDRRQKANTLAAHGSRFGNSPLDVPPVEHRPAETLDPRREPGVPDRRGAHVDAAPAGPEVEARADQGDRPAVRLPAHPAETTLAWNGRGRASGNPSPTGR